MEFVAMAQADFGDWIETIIVLVIVLGGVLQGIGKAIIKKIAVKKEEDAAKRIGLPQPGRGSQQGQRVARRSQPGQSQPGQSQSGQSQSGQAQPGRPVARPARPEASGRLHPSQMQAPRPVAPPVSGLPPIAPRPTTARPTTEAPVARRVARAKESGRSKPPGAQRLPRQTLRSKPSSGSERERPAEKQHETLVDHHLRLSDEVAHPSTAAEYHERPQSRNRLPKLTRSSLRDAIILREILGPPIALRNSSDDR